MKINVLYFSVLRGECGVPVEPMELRDGATVADAMVRAIELHPALAQHAQSVLAAVNEQWVAKSACLADGDTLALMPPVSGG